jgi:hypothetical protein
MANSSDSADESGAPPMGDEGIPLRTMGDVEREMARVYRDMRKKRLDHAIGNALTHSLQCIAKVKRETLGDDLTERIAQLERKAAEAEEQRAH